MPRSRRTTLTRCRAVGEWPAASANADASKRSSELVGGNLYWIVKHRVLGCNQILAFEDREDGRINIVCSAELEPVTPFPKRAHQGWRYFESDAAATADESGVGELPPQLYGRLSALALV